jgi:acyl-CoA thioester hydrolase
VKPLPAVERAAFWFLNPFRVRYAEADRQGRLFNAHYLTYFGTSMVEYMRALPFDLRGYEKKDNTAIHVVRAIVDIQTPVRFDDAIEVGVRTALMCPH